MRSHVHEFAAANIPFMFDPGQGLPLFSGSELIDMVDRADYLALNDYEGRLLAERTGLVARGDGGARRGADRDPRRRRFEHLHRRHETRHSSGRTGCGGRSDRLRRCLSRRAALRHRPGLGLAAQRSSCLAAGVTEDRRPRWAESRAKPRRRRRALSAGASARRCSDATRSRSRCTAPRARRASFAPAWGRSRRGWAPGIRACRRASPR